MVEASGNTLHQEESQERRLSFGARSWTYDLLDGNITREEHDQHWDEVRASYGLPVFPREATVLDALAEAQPTLEGPDARFLSGEITPVEYVDELDQERRDHDFPPQE